jgi:hypothetical protein
MNVNPAANPVITLDPSSKVFIVAKEQGYP